MRCILKPFYWNSSHVAMSSGRTTGFLDLVLLVWESVAFLLMAPVRVVIDTSLCSSTSFQDSIILETLWWRVSLSVPYPRIGLPRTKWLLQTLVFAVTRKSLRLISRSHNLREAARIFRESKISNEKSIFFLFYQNIPFCELVSKKIF